MPLQRMLCSVCVQVCVHECVCVRACVRVYWGELGENAALLEITSLLTYLQLPPPPPICDRMLMAFDRCISKPEARELDIHLRHLSKNQSHQMYLYVLFYRISKGVK